MKVEPTPMPPLARQRAAGPALGILDGRAARVIELSSPGPARTGAGEENRLANGLRYALQPIPARWQAEKLSRPADGEPEQFRVETDRRVRGEFDRQTFEGGMGAGEAAAEKRPHVHQIPFCSGSFGGFFR